MRYGLLSRPKKFKGQKEKLKMTSVYDEKEGLVVSESNLANLKDFKDKMSRRVKQLNILIQKRALLLREIQEIRVSIRTAKKNFKFSMTEIKESQILESAYNPGTIAYQMQATLLEIQILEKEIKQLNFEIGPTVQQLLHGDY